VGDIQSFDIGVFPLPGDRWTKGKCAMKLLQYMSCAVPSVSSANDVTSAIVTDGFNGFLASNPSQWMEKLKFLIKNPDKRTAIGAEGRKSIAGRFDAKTIARNYASLFAEAVASYQALRNR
ncbi:MAG: glycosyltransferase, partial [Syntrophales bacterium LBB04]|nr:glycosyltransferase [Syntrophales bacterium LBB04]